MRELESLDVVGEELKVAKRLQMIKNYINLSTLGYFYHTESEYEAIHYGNTPQKYSILQKKKILSCMTCTLMMVIQERISTGLVSRE